MRPERASELIVNASSLGRALSAWDIAEAVIARASIASSPVLGTDEDVEAVRDHIRAVRGKLDRATRDGITVSVRGARR